jgi:catechol 2,3-dioxygenase-like lactoylglutathione lyase family enzyme
MFSLSGCEVGASIAVSDIERSRRFYEDVLGLAPESDTGDNVGYRCARGTRINVFVSPHAGTAQSTQAGWKVDDMDAAVEELAAQGVTFERYDRGPIVTDERGVATFDGGNQVAYFADPDGNILSIAFVPASPGALLDPVAVATRLPAQDLERAERWYREKLGLEPVETRPGGLRYEVGGSTFVLFTSAGKPSGEHTQMAFDVVDIERAVRTLRHRGVEFDDVDAPAMHTVDKIADVDGNYPSKGRAERGAWFRDSEGNLLGIGQTVH